MVTVNGYQFICILQGMNFDRKSTALPFSFRRCDIYKTLLHFTSNSIFCLQNIISVKLPICQTYYAVGYNYKIIIIIIIIIKICRNCTLYLTVFNILL